jgi:catechol 2,3-dioxygenase-like lactoylglutathione lyase family enzyme
MTVATRPVVQCYVRDLSCIYLPVANVYESVQWYQQNLGLTPTHHNPVKPEMDFVIMSYPAKGPAVFLIQRGEVTTSNFKNKGGYQMPAVCFDVSDIAALFAHMRENGVNFENESLEERGGCGTNFKCFDPDGNKLDFNQSPKSARRITGIACINLPVSDVEASARWYTDVLGCTLLREPTRFEENTNAMLQLGWKGPTVLMHEEKDRAALHFQRDGQPAPIFELQIGDIDAFYAKLQEQCAMVSDRYDNPGCGKYFKVKDPDGNWLTIVE